MNAIHPTAFVDEAAQLGKGVTVGPHAVIEADVRVGDDCRIGPGAVLHRHTRMGARCTVHAHAVLGDLPQDLGFEGGTSFVEIGDDCVFREGVTVNRGTREGSVTRVGDHCYLMACSHLAHNVTLGNHVILANGALCGGYVEVGDRVFVSSNVGIHQFCRIGRLAMLGGNGGISQDVAPFCMTRTVGFNQAVGLNTVGLRRAGITPDERKTIKQAYILLCRSGLSTPQAIERIRSECPHPLALEMADFAAGAKRGVCRQGD